MDTTLVIGISVAAAWMLFHPRFAAPAARYLLVAAITTAVFVLQWNRPQRARSLTPALLQGLQIVWMVAG